MEMLLDNARLVAVSLAALVGFVFLIYVAARVGALGAMRSIEEHRALRSKSKENEDGIQVQAPKRRVRGEARDPTGR
jgi:hypothetical protein